MMKGIDFGSDQGKSVSVTRAIELGLDKRLAITIVALDQLGALAESDRERLRDHYLEKCTLSSLWGQLANALGILTTLSPRITKKKIETINWFLPD